MNTAIKTINAFFKNATKDDIENLLSKIVLTERQETVFKMFYIRGFNIGYIADTLFVSSTVVSRELARIRRKISKIICQK